MCVHIMFVCKYTHMYKHIYLIYIYIYAYMYKVWISSESGLFLQSLAIKVILFESGESEFS